MELSKLDKVIEKPTIKMSIQEYWAIFFRYLTDKDKRRKINEILAHEDASKCIRQDVNYFMLKASAKN